MILATQAVGFEMSLLVKENPSGKIYTLRTASLLRPRRKQYMAALRMRLAELAGQASWSSPGPTPAFPVQAD